jgi:hypothetical protein
LNCWLVGFGFGGLEGWWGRTIVGAEDLALLADTGAWFGHGFCGMCVCVCVFSFAVVVVVGVATRIERERESREFDDRELTGS